MQGDASLWRAKLIFDLYLRGLGGFRGFAGRRGVAGLLAACLALAACQQTGPGSLPAMTADLSRSSAPDISAEEMVFALEPFKSAPGNTADDISRRIAELAAREGLNLNRRNGPDTTHRVLGYLSVTGDESRGVLVYVFDIFDRSGTRVHRFTGQEAVGPSSGDPWAGVDRAAISNLSARTVQSLRSWANEVPDR